MGLGEIYELDNIRVVDLSHNLNLFQDICPLSRQDLKLVLLLQGKIQAETHMSGSCNRWRVTAHLDNLWLLFKVRMQMGLGLFATQYRQRFQDLYSINIVGQRQMEWIHEKFGKGR